jgi:hypothetical protein
MKTTGYVLVFVCMFHLSCSTVNPWLRTNNVSQWQAVPPPNPGSEAWRCANWSSAWDVRFNQDTIVAGLKDNIVPWTLPFPRPQLDRSDDGVHHSIQVSDGWIVGFNGGEFGCSLWWFAPDGKQRYKISKDQVVGFIRIENEIFGIEGLAHMGTNRGRVIRLVKSDKSKRWQSSELTKLHEAPSVVLSYTNNSMLIVTESGLAVVSTNGEVATLLNAVFWGGLYPNSAVLDSSGFLFIGMNQGVAKVSSLEQNPKVEWLVPSKAFLREEEKEYKKRMSNHGMEPIR